MLGQRIVFHLYAAEVNPIQITMTLHERMHLDIKSFALSLGYY